MPGGTDPAFANLSAAELAQLGKPRVLAGGGESVYRVVPASHWPRVRQLLLERGRGYVPGLQAELSAYTPGETPHLLEHPRILDWHSRMAEFVIPRPVQAVALVPCARA